MQPGSARPRLPDSTLVDLARRGDQDALGELMERQRAKCLDMAMRFLRNRADAEDEVQDAFFRACTHFDQYRGEAEFFCWLSGIVRNDCLMLMRGRHGATFLYFDAGEVGDDSLPLELSGCGPDPEGEVALRQLQAFLGREIRSMPPLFRNILLLHDVLEFPLKDAAKKLGISLPAAKSRLSRARIELRLRLLRHGEKNAPQSLWARFAAPVNRVEYHRAIRSWLLDGSAAGCA